MKAVTGTDFVDNQWGFGQVIAIFLWVPLLIQVLYYTCRMLLTSCQCNTRMITDFSAVLAHTYFKPTEQTELRRSYHRCRSYLICWTEWGISWKQSRPGLTFPNEGTIERIWSWFRKQPPISVKFRLLKKAWLPVVSPRIGSVIWNRDKTRSAAVSWLTGFLQLV
jgi:hypothetical protein